jgi:ClpX C4-type zinc finger
MPDEEIMDSAPAFEYVSVCLRAIDERRYRDALTSLNAGITKQLAFPQSVDAGDLLKHFGTLISYLDFRLGEDFGTQWEAQPNEEDQTQIRCSFCGKTEPEVNKIIAGPGVFICNECIRGCADALTKE